MVTKSMTDTPFGKKLVYKIDGECIWSEYLPFRSSREQPHTIAYRDRTDSLLRSLSRGVCNVLLRRAS